MSFNEKYQNIKQPVLPELEKTEEIMISKINVREPLNSSVKDFLKLPSKRIRSVVSLLYLKACKKEITPAHYNLLAAVELVHNASLIHDDVIDKSDLRRAHKTLSAEFDNKLAVISGDYLLSIATELLTSAGSIEVFKMFAQTLNNMCQGEINQNFDRFKIGTIENYIEKTKNKTAYLFEAALNSVMLVSDGKINSDAQNFALNFGIAFQIRDDLLNVECSDPTKPENSDIQDGIYNAPVIYAGSVENYKAGIELTRSLLNNYIKSAKNYLNNLPDNQYRTALYELLELLKDE